MLVYRIRKALAKALQVSLDQRQFGLLVGFNKDQVGELERNESRGEGTIERFARHFDTTPDELEMWASRRGGDGFQSLLARIAQNPKDFTVPVETPNGRADWRQAERLALLGESVPTEVTDQGQAVGNSSVRIENRTRYTEGTPLVDEPADTRGEEAEMHHADQVAVIGQLLAMTPLQVREVRTFVNFVVSRDRRGASGKSAG
jgi:hypothetical protein